FFFHCIQLDVEFPFFNGLFGFQQAKNMDPCLAQEGQFNSIIRFLT
ncbi:MAG: hypothetical protein JWP84_3084, partial [Tardiphaga sp.]|nr:hypothetical protein [Tardiphaga sp.]